MELKAIMFPPSEMFDGTYCTLCDPEPLGEVPPWHSSNNGGSNGGNIHIGKPTLGRFLTGLMESPLYRLLCVFAFGPDAEMVGVDTSGIVA